MCSVWALCARTKFKALRVGASATNEIQGDIATQWKRLSAQEKFKFKAEAGRMQAKRDELMQQPLGDQQAAEGSGSGLTYAQKHRLGNARLDKTLQQVSEHAVWRKGLGIWDHVSALRKEHVMSSAEDIETLFQNIFAYDGKIILNEQMPSYQQSCISCGGGVCRQHALYHDVSRVVSQFDGILLQQKLVMSRPALVAITPDSTGDVEPSEATWMIMGCVGRRPIVHIVMILWKSDANSFQLSMENGRPKITTLHRAALSMLRKYEASGGNPAQFAAQAGV